MNRNSSKLNFLYNMIYQITLMILPLVTMPYVARILGADGIGTYSYTYSIAQYFLLFGMLGVENYGNRAIARVRESKNQRDSIFSSIYLLQFIIATISAFIYLIYTIFIAKNIFFALIQMLYVISGMFDINWVFWGVEDFKLTVTKKVAVKIINVICIFVFVRTKNDLWKYLLVLSLGYFIAQSSMWLFSRRYVSFKRCSFREAFRHFKGIVILFIPIIATSIYRMMDKVMIGSFCDMAQVGFYENSEKLINVCLCVISAFGAVMMPRISNMLARNLKEECRDLFVRSMEIAIFIGSAIAFGIGSIANDFIPIFYGNGYEECIKITMMLSTTVLFITWACIVRTLYLIPTEKNKIYISSVISGAVINLVINALLIPRFEAVGAAVGTIIAEITVAVTQTVFVSRELDIMLCIKKSVPFILFGIIMYGFVKLVPISVNGTVLLLLCKILCGAVVYLTFSVFYFIKTKNKVFFDTMNKVKSFVVR